MKFHPDQIFNPSYKMGEVSGVSIQSLTEKLGPSDGDSGDGKSAAGWNGMFTASNGSKHRASAWDWHGGIVQAGVASVWINNPDYLSEFIRFLEGK